MGILNRRSQSQDDDFTIIEKLVKRRFASGQRFSAANVSAILRKDCWSRNIGKKKVRTALRQLVDRGTLECFPVYSYRSYRRPGKGMRRKPNGCEFAIAK